MHPLLPPVLPFWQISWCTRYARLTQLKEGEKNNTTNDIHLDQTQTDEDTMKHRATTAGCSRLGAVVLRLLRHKFHTRRLIENVANDI